MTHRSYAVVGGGASGIAIAHYLQKQGLKVELIERGDSIGGRLASCKLGDRQVAMGGKNIGKNYHLFRQFTEAMGDNPYEFFGLNSSQVRDGKIVTIDGKQRWRSLFNLLRRFAPKDIFRFLQMCLAIKSNRENGYLSSPYFTSLIRKLGDQPVSTYFGTEFCRRLIRPMSVRMNGAEPDEVYLGNLGSNIALILDTYEQLSNGIDRVLEQFATTVTVRTQTTVKSLIYANGCVVGLQLFHQGQIEERMYAGVIIATPAPVTAQLVAPHNPLLAEILKEICYYPVMVIVAQYNRNIFSEEVRALVFDGDEPLSNAGSYGINDRHIVRYTFSGRVARKFIEAKPEAEELLKIAEATLNRYIPVDGNERVQFVSQLMLTGLCAYTHDHYKFAQGLETQLENLEGLFLTGDYLQGASIEACFRASKTCAEKVLHYDKTNSQHEFTAQNPRIEDDLLKVASSLN